jgi:hypothetical protein
MGLIPAITQVIRISQMLSVASEKTKSSSIQPNTAEFLRVLYRTPVSSCSITMDQWDVETV